MTKHKYSDVDFINAVENSFSIRGVLIKLGVAPHGGSYKTFYLRVNKLNIDFSHFTGKAYMKGKHNNHVKKIPLDKLLVVNSDKVLSVFHKQRIIDEGLLENKCIKCGLKDIWNNESIVLHIDHINGDHFDHRIENLRMLCPNCHSQTITYCAKNKKHNVPLIRKSEYLPQDIHKCSSCGLKLSNNRSKVCGSCYNENRKELQSKQERKTKIIWPTIEELKSKLETISYVALGKELGVSDSAIRKHIKQNGAVAVMVHASG